MVNSKRFIQAIINKARLKIITVRRKSILITLITYVKYILNNDLQKFIYFLISCLLVTFSINLLKNTTLLEVAFTYIFLSIYCLMTFFMNFTKANFLVVILGLVFLCSCSSKKEVIYFNDIDPNNHDKNIFSAGQIQTNDILSIIVSSSSSELSAIYNLNQDQNQNTTAFPGYLVNLEGTITLPIIGKLVVKGLSLSELEDQLVKKLKEEHHLTAPIVTARLMNAKFTVLGEVNKPGTYTFSEQNISLLQAIGYAGDLTINGKRENVLLIREENNVKTYITINMTSKNWFGSPNYFIKPNDVIYVNPNGPKVKSAGYIGNLGTFISVVSVSLSLALTVILLTK